MARPNARWRRDVDIFRTRDLRLEAAVDAFGRVWWKRVFMSHHLFLLSPSDTPLYTLTHYSTKPTPSVTSPLSANLPNWSTSAFAGTLTALSGASSATHHTTGGGVRMGGGQDRHVIQMIANASLDAIEDVMRKENLMYVVRSERRIGRL